ncbi:acyltransferase family protein [Hymenobacter sp. DG25B]|uniref:acyltransferase family protein n=1 Tax=Hymenobacter sp. DG25B TaxID=1385664 RepID=UPI0005CA61D9|nr:acyltransferase [Hymenobacter sp. DG25B]
METKKYAYIDALRGVAVLAVLAVHCAEFGTSLPAHSSLAGAAALGARGVQLFYIMSALTLFLSMSGRSKAERFATLNFFLRRFFRIAPLFYCAILYYLWQDGWGPRYWLGDAPGITLAGIIATITFTNGINPYWINSIVPGGWSIAVEMLFYLLVPVLFRVVTTGKRALWLLGVTLAGAVAFNVVLANRPLITNAELWSNFLFMAFPTQLPIFAMGIVLFFLLRPPVAGSALAFRPAALLIGTALLLASLLLGNLVPSYLIFGVAFVMLAYALAHMPTRWLVNGATEYIGRISYSLYLTHFAVLHAMQYWGIMDLTAVAGERGAILNYALRYLLLLLLATVVATLTYYLIEKPGMQAGKWLIGRLEQAGKRQQILQTASLPTTA